MSNIQKPDPFDVDATWIRRSALDTEELLSRVPWDELRVFLAVAKQRSMNRVASHLGTSRRKISSQLQHLQISMGSQLFVQSRSGTKLTERGEALADFLARFDRDLSSMAAELAVENLKTEGSVRLTITDGLGMMFFVPALRLLAKRHPRIQVNIKTPLSFRSLKDNQTDLMLGFQPECSQSVISEEVGTLHLLPIASQMYIEECGLPTRDNLRKHRFVDSDQYASRSGSFLPWQILIEQGRVAHLCDTSLSYAMLIKGGHGIGLLGNYVVIEPSFVPLDLDVHVRVQLYTVALRERLKSKPVRVVYDLLSDVFGKSNPWFSDTLTVDTSILPLSNVPIGLFRLPHI